jgi:hypothetical protein
MKGDLRRRAADKVQQPMPATKGLFVMMQHTTSCSRLKWAAVYCRSIIVPWVLAECDSSCKQQGERFKVEVMP